MSRQEQYQQGNVDASFRPEQAPDLASRYSAEARNQEQDLRTFLNSKQKNDEVDIANAKKAGQGLEALAQFSKTAARYVEVLGKQ